MEKTRATPEYALTANSQLGVQRRPLVATIPVGNLPHGIWPSGDGTRVYVGLEHADQMVEIDTLSNKVIATVPTGQVAQAVTYVSNAVREGDGAQNTEPFGLAGQAARLALVPVGTNLSADTASPMSVALFDQGLVQIMQLAATGPQPKQPYVFGLSDRPDGSDSIDALAHFMTNTAGAAIVDALGQMRQLVAPGQDASADRHRYLVIAPLSAGRPGTPG